MRTNTYIRLEMLYKKYKGYVETREILEEGFSNRQIAVLVKEGYLENVTHGHYWLSGGNVRSLKTINVLKYVLAIQRLLFVWTVLFIIRRLVQRNQSIYRLRQSEQTVVY